VIQVVSPYRPFPPESDAHQQLGAFDWIEALHMLADSVTQTCGCPTYAITDVATPLPVPYFGFKTTAPRLMEWMLDVSLAFLQSQHFHCDTVLVCPDTLVCQDLRPLFRADLGLIIRTDPKHAARPILNSCQFWSVSAKPELIRFYTAALAIARELEEPWQVWGGDTEPLRQLVAPCEVGEWMHVPTGLLIQMWEASSVMESLSGAAMEALDDGQPYRPSRAFLDFKGLRKRRMAQAFRAVFPQGVTS
jgi:hypothetical protein